MQEKRKYIRIATVLPVEFFVADSAGKQLTPWLQGFTQDISKGGVCLTVNDLWWGFWDKLKVPGSYLSLRVDLPLKKTLVTRGRITWYDEEKSNDFTQYKVGIEFLTLEKKETHQLFKYALFKKYLPVGVATALTVLLAVSLALWWNNHVLIEKNRKLVSSFVASSDKIATLQTQVEKKTQSNELIKRRREELQASIANLEREVVDRQKKLEFFQAGAKTDEGSLREASVMKERIALLQKELHSLQRESTFLKVKEEEAVQTASQLQDDLATLEKQQFTISEKIIGGLYDWIKNRQDLIHGLVISYEGDRSLDKICFTYDQSLAAIVFLLYGDRPRAEKILDFYLARVNDEEIYNAYYSQGEVAEFTIHSGPNAWIGIAALIYTKETKDQKYLPIAAKVFTMLTRMMDSEGGVKGGPKDDWYATEHNLDTYAFFNLYYEVTGDDTYKRIAEKVKGWISQYSYTQYGPPVNRGKGDATIATDTYAWSVTALGPKVLLGLRMDPDAILEFAVDQCEVLASFTHRGNTVQARGFDFAKARNIAREGVISCEWTAQMILSFEIMANYYEKKDPVKYRLYCNKALLYANELQKLLITSPSKAGREDPCFPYASGAQVDTGHGWRTPAGNRTGSLSSTSYFLIAYFGYNPLRGEKLSVSLKDLYETRIAASTAKPD